MNARRSRFLPCILPMLLAIAPAWTAPRWLHAVDLPPAPKQSTTASETITPRRAHRAHRHAGARGSRPRVREIEPESDLSATTAAPRVRKNTPAARADARAGAQRAAREAAARESRAESIYRLSQTSAPIIPDATACRRIGANGETIYENCGIDPAARPVGAR